MHVYDISPGGRRRDSDESQRECGVDNKKRTRVLKMRCRVLGSVKSISFSLVPRFLLRFILFIWFAWIMLSFSLIFSILLICTSYWAFWCRFAVLVGALGCFLGLLGMFLVALGISGAPSG